MKYCYPCIPKESQEEAERLQNLINEMYQKRTKDPNPCRFQWNDKQHDMPGEIGGFVYGNGEWVCHTKMTAYPFKSMLLDDILKQMTVYDFMKIRRY